MPRKPRFCLPEVPVHAIQRGHSREPVFFEDKDYQAYLIWLYEAAERYDCAIHAYVMMSNHVHILATPKTREGISRMMQYVGRRYVPYINNQYGTSGSLWEGRYKSSLVEEDNYLLVCMRYIELNPVRADMVTHPRHYRWSSYRVNAEGKEDKGLTAHGLYQALGRSVKQRKIAYRALFKAHIEDDEISTIRDSWQTGTPLGSDRFKVKIEAKLQCKVGQARRGRPSIRALTP